MTPVKSVAVANDAAGRYAVGPSKYPERTTQSVGKLAGEPVLPHDDTLVKVAPLRSAPVRLLPANVAFARLAPLRSVDDRFVLAKVAFVRLALLRSVDDTFALVNRALAKFTPEKFTVLISAPVRLAVGPTK